MNTQPMDEYLNRERLTDLAQFAVPDGHDLWPKIERAARASASGMTTQRPGILSLGLSRAWTAVGILLIAATFAALGFGLAVLVLSNGHDLAPAAPVTPTPTASTASASPTPMPTTQQAGANTPPLYEPDYPRDLNHIRETLGSVFVPTYTPDGYQLGGANVNTDPLLLFEASLVYRNGRRGPNGEAVGEFFIYQFPENWDADTHEPNFDEQTIDGLTVRRPWNVRDRAAFYFQADGRWHYVSVFGESPENVDMNELVRVAKSVQGFSAGDTVDWLAISGITRRGFGNNVLSALDDFIEGRKDSIYISGHLPNNLGLESIWISQDSDSLTLEFVLPSHLRDGRRLERVTLSTSANPTLYREQVDVGGSTGYVFWGTSSSDVTLVFQHEGRWFELEGSPATDKSVLDELIKMALSLELYGQPERRNPAQTNIGTPSTIPSREAAHAELLNILTGETLDRYRALPPAYQEALGLYTWHQPASRSRPIRRQGQDRPVGRLGLSSAGVSRQRTRGEIRRTRRRDRRSSPLARVVLRPRPKHQARRHEPWSGHATVHGLRSPSRHQNTLPFRTRQRHFKFGQGSHGGMAAPRKGLDRNGPCTHRLAGTPTP